MRCKMIFTKRQPVSVGEMITEAEANDGIMKLMVKDSADTKAYEVIVKLPALGAYSETWPLNCKKSDTIVRNFADYLGEHKKSVGIGLDGAMLFMLSTVRKKIWQSCKNGFSKLSKNIIMPRKSKLIPGLLVIMVRRFVNIICVPVIHLSCRLLRNLLTISNAQFTMAHGWDAVRQITGIWAAVT